MPKISEDYYAFDDLSHYSLRQRMLIRAADITFYSFVQLLSSTVKLEYEGTEHLRSVREAGKSPIFVAWHDRIILGTKLLKDQAALVVTSKSFDGEYIARFVKRLGFGTIRGSSSRGGLGAMIRMIRASRDGHAIVFMVDGPRGPRHQVKAGPVTLAQQTSNPIIPVSIQPRRFTRLNSWDRMQIPTPFTTALVSYGLPIYADGQNDAESAMQLALDELERRGEAYIAG